MPWFLDHEKVPNPPLSEDATEMAVLLAAGRMPPVEVWSLNAAMELIERDVLCHSDIPSMEERLKLLAKGYSERSS
jgi:hypothetical protein